MQKKKNTDPDKTLLCADKLLTVDEHKITAQRVRLI